MAETPGQVWKYYRQPQIVEVESSPTALRRDGSGSSLLYLHGAGFTRQWLPIHTALAERFDVIAPEHPGFGDTPQRSGFRDFTDYVLHYDALLRELDVTDLHLVGHGLGARLAAHLATVYPTRFATLTLVAPTGLRDSDEPLIDEFRLSPEQRRSREFNGREESSADVLELKGFPDDTIDAYADSTANALLTWTNRTDRILGGRLSRIVTPTLVISAEDDRYAGASSARCYANLIAGASLTVVAGPDGEPSSHAVHIEQPTDVAALIVAHIDRNTASAER